MNGTLLLGVLVGLALGALAVALIDRARRMRAASAQAATQETAARIVEEARKEATTLRTEAELRAKDVVIQAKAEAEREGREQRVAQKEESLDHRGEALQIRESDLASRDDAFKEKERVLEGRRSEAAALV